MLVRVKVRSQLAHGGRPDTANSVQLTVVDGTQMIRRTHTRRKQCSGDGDINTNRTYTSKEFLGRLTF